ncbi:DUF6105 family protein [Chelativorans sp. M5D2P16]|uniref:DUF6105 family protein n=1 Tax=Chelativorans sp. M5D2P16 TaxID=3095678 RepID=UPI002ACA1F45|nr:DUF6105 family protein [Chelativorans sp. M5D2P16]MDZ5696378.1 DUF6105 family protein [Chelativorans sp. M5D2P16]
MRYILIFWGLPMGLIWGWYFLSLHDMHFGFFMLTREVHDYTFAIYGQILGIEPAAIPPLLARACVIDTLILLAIFAFRRRRAIQAWIAARRGGYPREDAPRSA